VQNTNTTAIIATIMITTTIIIQTIIKGWSRSRAEQIRQVAEGSHAGSGEAWELVSVHLKVPEAYIRVLT